MSGAKRFYKTASLRTGDGGYQILLDDKPVWTPAREQLRIASEALAREVVSEWEKQGEKIDPASMPMTKRANTAIDRVRGREAEVAADIVSYAGTDLLCYRAESPEGLVDMQRAQWDPVLDWAAREFGAPFEVQEGIAHIEQPATALEGIAGHIKAFDCLALTPLHTMTTLTGSALLVLAHASGTLDADTAWAAAHVDEDWQISRWGEDAEASARRAVRRAEFDADVRFLELVRPS